MVDRVDGVVDGSNNWAMDSMVNTMVRDGVGHQGSSVDGVMGDHGGGVDSVVSNGVDGGLVCGLGVGLENDVPFLIIPIGF